MIEIRQRSVTVLSGTEVVVHVLVDGMRSEVEVNALLRGKYRHSRSAIISGICSWNFVRVPSSSVCSVCAPNANAASFHKYVVLSAAILRALPPIIADVARYVKLEGLCRLALNYAPVARIQHIKRPPYQVALSFPRKT